jgi:hypothetical protein
MREHDEPELAAMAAWRGGARGLLPKLEQQRSCDGGKEEGPPSLLCAR